MSFFEVSPMGSGMSMGGVSVGGKRSRMSHRLGKHHMGGVSVGGNEEYGIPMGYMGEHHMGGVMMPMGGAMSKEEKKEQVKKMKALIKERAQKLSEEIYVDEDGREFKIGKNEALGKAKDEIMAELKQGRKVAMEKTPRITKKALGKRVRTYRDKVEKDAKEAWYPIYSDLSHKGLTKEQLSAIDASLKAVGFGVYHMATGSAWYDDLWSGVKKVGETALNVAPHLLPLLL